MKPRHATFLDRRHILRNTLAAWIAIVIAAVCGCAPLALRTQNPEGLAGLESEVRLIGDHAVPFGTNYLKIEVPVLITGLTGTGSDPPPSPLRTALIGEMRARKVERPNQVLVSPTTTIAIAQGQIAPGAQKGDRIDIEVHLPERSEATSLEGGYLMQCRLRDMAILDGQSHEGHVRALARGALLTAKQSDGDESNTPRRGRVLGGGYVVKSRSLGLAIKPDSQSALLSKRIGDVINFRFHTFDRGRKVGVAKPKTDKFIELQLHPRYKDNIPRYLRVVRALAVRQGREQEKSRLDLLSRQLTDPLTASAAAIKLEAIGGQDAVQVLKRGIAVSSPEVRFYAAEALAYLDQPEAADVLVAAIRDVPNLRPFAFAALSSMDDVSAYEALNQLLRSSDNHARYGAFRALRAMNPADGVVRGENMGGEFSYHTVSTRATPMVHVAKSRRPEVVVFGTNQRFRTPLLINVGKDIMVTSAPGDSRVTVSRFTLDGEDQERIVSSRIDDVIRAIVELGGSYPDVVQTLIRAKQGGVLDADVAIDVLSKPARNRVARSKASEKRYPVASPKPGLFSQRGG